VLWQKADGRIERRGMTMDTDWRRPNASGKWTGYPNLRRRPPRPAEMRGRLQRAVLRAFIASDASELSTTALADWAYARSRRGLSSGEYWSLRRVCRQLCERVGRAPTIGRPWLWRLKG
jgi:hypothetical protein